MVFVIKCAWSFFSTQRRGDAEGLTTKGTKKARSILRELRLAGSAEVFCKVMVENSFKSYKIGVIRVPFNRKGRRGAKRRVMQKQIGRYDYLSKQQSYYMTPTSKIIIGCMSWGAWGKQLSTKAQAELIQFCLENGFTNFDHADIYGDYTTEAEFGLAWKESGVDREELQLISKCGIQYVGKTRNNSIKHYNYSKEYIIWSAEESLRNLQTEYLDTFLLHRPSPLMHPDEIAEAITALQSSGKIRAFGVSNFTPSQVDLVASKIPVSVNQIEFSLTQNTAMYDGTLDQMLQKNIQPMCWSPLGSVFKEKTEQTDRIHAVLKTLSDKYDLTPDALLLAWILSHPAQVSPVIGTTNKERIVHAKRALEMTLELEDWFLMLEAGEGRKVP